jgi:excisionase family DNA binding protein
LAIKSLLCLSLCGLHLIGICITNIQQNPLKKQIKALTMDDLKDCLLRIESLLQQKIALEKEYLTSRELAQVLNITLDSLYHLCSANQISYLKPNGKLIFFKRSDVVIFLERNRIKSVDEITRDALSYGHMNPTTNKPP